MRDAALRCGHRRVLFGPAVPAEGPTMQTASQGLRTAGADTCPCPSPRADGLSASACWRLRPTRQRVMSSRRTHVQGKALAAEMPESQSAEIAPMTSRLAEL